MTSGAAQQTAVPPPVIESRSLPVAIRSLAIGDFAGDSRAEIAV
jgi:hypothetical protein